MGEFKPRGRKKDDRPDKPSFKKGFKGKRNFKKGSPKKAETHADQGLIRLNRYLANAGVASRREADKLIAAGSVKINGKVVTELGTKVKPGDEVHYGGEKLGGEKKRYVLLNKPKDYITTMDDPQKRRTVVELVQRACSERIYPVGRLDRATSGLLLMSNDGELTMRLTHPSSNVKKVYKVGLSQNVSQNDLIKLVEGVELEDGVSRVDKAFYHQDGADKSQVILELHSGKNRVIRRMMEKLGYKVIRLDRIQFAGLTKKDLPRGRFRHLSEKEVGLLHKVAGIQIQH
ncbi:MAG: pseudouridine synthase [Vicingaceae bacterium]